MGDQDLISEMEQVLDQQSCFLSDDLIIEEILTRLPVKSILRFKSVSKQWYSTLSSSHFANAHLIKSPFPHPSTPVDTLFIQSGSNCYIFSYNDDQISGNFQDNLVSLDPSEFWVQKDDLVLTGCCNGLICFTPLYNTYFIIWNPATRKMHKYESDYRNTLPFFCGFGYVSSVDDYKYVHVTSRKGSGSEKSNHVAHIFSLKENKWKRLDFYAQDYVFIFGESVLINEILYWRASFPGADDFILSFDLGVEMFDTVNLDPGPGNILGVMGECLSKCESSDANTGEILMHICESTGAMVISIGVPEGLRLNLNSQMIGFTRTGNFFATGTLTDDIWDSQCRRLGIVDTATKPMQYTTLLKFDERIYIARYVPSLVSPFPGEELSRA